jgi:hypothetical protein
MLKNGKPNTKKFILICKNTWNDLKKLFFHNLMQLRDIFHIYANRKRGGKVHCTYFSRYVVPRKLLAITKWAKMAGWQAARQVRFA